MTGGVLFATVAITLWHAYSGPERTGLERSVAEANRALAARGARIEPVAIPFDALYRKVDTAVPRGRGPDLFIGAHDRLGDWRRRKVIAPPAARGAVPPDALLPAVRAALAGEDGRLWAVPVTYKGFVLYRNTALCAKPPKTLAAIEALRSALPERAYPLAYDAGSLFFHSPLLLALGGGVFEETAGTAGGGGGVPAGARAPPRFRIFDKAAERSYALAQRLARGRVIPRECSSALASQLFNRQRAATVISGPWFAGGIELPAGRWAVSPLPRIAGRSAGSFITVEGLFLAATSEQRDLASEAAWALAMAWRPRTLSGSQPPVLRAAYEGAAGAALPPLVRAQRAALEHGRITPRRREMAWVWEPVGGLLKDIVDRDRPLAPSLARARHRLQVLARPAPPPVRPTLYLIALGGLLLAGALVLVRRASRPELREAVRRSRSAYLLSLPALLAMAALVVAPFVVGSALSFFSHHDGHFTFIGIGNFQEILLARDFPVTDPLSFYFTLGVTVLWTVVNVALHTGIGLALALMLRKPWLRLRGVYRVLLILPWAVPSYITALVWRGMFDFQLGAINAVLGRLGAQPVGWFQGFWTAFGANVTTNTWLGFPFMMVVALGALQAVPADLEEVCALEGASRWQTFRHAVWPVVRPALVPAVLLGSVWTFNMFNVIYLVSGGEPGGSTEILISEAYKWAFERQHRYGYAAAYAVVIFVVLWSYGRVIARAQREDG